MRRISLLLSLVIGLAIFLGAGGSIHPVAVQASGPEAANGRILVAFNPPPAGSRGTMRASHPGLTYEKESENGRFQVYRTEPGNETETLQALRNNPSVRVAEPDFPLQATLGPTSSQLQKQWALSKVNAPAAWQSTTGSADIIVAIIDSGVDPSHPEFAGRLLTGWNFVADNSNTNDDFGHGTHVAGIAASAGASSGVYGMAWQVKILPLKILNENGGGVGSDLISAIDMAISRGAKIINVSLGSSVRSTLMEEAIQRAINAGVVVVSSAGNSGPTANTPSYPAAFTDVIAVAATDQQDRRASFSTSGSYVDIAAPGVDIYSTYKNGGYATLSGTSMASPMVAGFAALIWSYNPSLTASQVRQAIFNSAVGVTAKNDELGYGRIDAGVWAQTATQGSSASPATPTAVPPTPTTPPMPTATPVVPTATPAKPTATPAIKTVNPYPGPSKPIAPTATATPRSGRDSSPANRLGGASMIIYVPSSHRDSALEN